MQQTHSSEPHMSRSHSNRSLESEGGDLRPQTAAVPGMSARTFTLPTEIIQEFSPRLTLRPDTVPRKLFHKGRPGMNCFKHLVVSELESMVHPAVAKPDHWAPSWQPKTARQALKVPPPRSPTEPSNSKPSTARGCRPSPRTLKAQVPQKPKTAARKFAQPDTGNPRSPFYQGGVPLLRPRGGNNFTAYNGYAEIRRKVEQSEHRMKQACAGKSAFRYMEPLTQSVDTVESDWLDLECKEVEQMIAESERIKDQSNLLASEQWDLSKIEKNESKKTRRRSKLDPQKDRSQIKTPDLLDAFFKSQLMMGEVEAIRTLNNPKFKRQLLHRAKIFTGGKVGNHWGWIDGFEEKHNNVMGNLQKRLAGQERSRFASSVTRLHALSSHLESLSSGNDGGAEKALNMVRLEVQNTSLAEKLKIYKRFSWYIALTTMQEKGQLELRHRELEFVNRLKKVAETQEDVISLVQLSELILENTAAVSASDVADHQLLHQGSDTFRPLLFTILTQLGVAEDGQNMWLKKLLKNLNLGLSVAPRANRLPRSSGSLSRPGSFITQDEQGCSINLADSHKSLELADSPSP